MNRISGTHRKYLRRKFLEQVTSAPAAGLTASMFHLPENASGRPPVPQEPESRWEGRLAIRRDRPSLHLTRDGLADWKARARGTHRRYVELLHEAVERSARWVPPTIRSQPGAEVLLEETGAFLTNAALSWLLTGERSHLELARRWALSLCAQPLLQVRNYGRGVYAAGLGRVYDWLYDELSRPERQVIRTHLESLVRGLYQASFPETSSTEWWAELLLHHDHWIAVGGFGEAALALAPEMPEAVDWAGRARADFDAVFSWTGEDGAWHEGPADWAYALAPLLWFYSAWQSVTGENLHEIPWLRNTAAYRLYHWLPDGTYVYLDDSFRSGRYNTSGSASCHLLRRLASLFSDGCAQWLADRDEIADLSREPEGVFQAPYEGYSYRGELATYPNAASHCAAWNVLWYDPGVRPTNPASLPRAMRFENQEIAILRTGWDRDAAVVSLCSGPLAGKAAAARIRSGERLDAGNVHHSHADYGSVTLFAGGEYLIVPSGYARRSSRFQNVISVNGGDFLPDPGLDIAILAFQADPDLSYVAADATEAFPSHLGVASYRRHVLLFHEGWLVLFDDLRLKTSRAESFNRFEWKLHTDPARHRISASGREARWSPVDGREDSLTLYLLQPEEFAWVEGGLQSIDGKPLPGSIGFVRPEWYQQEMKVLAVLAWGKSGNETPMGIPGLSGCRWSGSTNRPSVAFVPSTEAASRVATTVPAGRERILVGLDRPGKIVRQDVGDDK